MHELIVDRAAGGFRQASASEMERFHSSRRSGPRRRREAALRAGAHRLLPPDFGGLDCRRIGSCGVAVPPSTFAAGSSAACSAQSPSSVAAGPPLFGPRPAGMSDSDDSDLGSFMRELGDLSDVDLSEGQVIEDILEDFWGPAPFVAVPSAAVAASPVDGPSAAVAAPFVAVPSGAVAASPVAGPSASAAAASAYVPPVSARVSAASPVAAVPGAGPSPSFPVGPSAAAADVASVAGPSVLGGRPLAVCWPVARVRPVGWMPPPVAPFPPPPSVVVDSDDDDVIFVGADLPACPVSAAVVASIVRLAPGMPAREVFEGIRARVPMSPDASRHLLTLIEGVIAGERQTASDVAVGVSAAVAVDPSGQMAVQVLQAILDAIARRPS